ncbi:MAG: hypothetical protein EOP88_00125 [Verrucomicrobiaceae bacterium]|nr:MAG: hypothetical protein EOP88_00125 [Verrucomicrobiaceae bacterium]
MTEEEFVSSYEQIFEERGGVTPSDPLEFHLYHLAEYWGRLVGFSRVWPDSPGAFVKGGPGDGIRVANRFAAGVIEDSPAISEAWQTYVRLADVVLNEPTVSVIDVEAASEALDRCRAILKAAGPVAPRPLVSQSPFIP